MISFEDLKNDRQLINQIDWDLTPQEAFEAYQIKSVGAWRYRSLPDVLYIYISVWQEQAKVVLVKRGLKSSQEVCLIPVPQELLSACLAEQAGPHPKHGQYPLGETVRTWIRHQLGL